MDHPIDDDARWPESEWENSTLPDEFDISNSCLNGHVAWAIGRCTNGVWTSTQLVTRGDFAEIEDRRRRERELEQPD